jgi:peptidoglycan/xylan/chitin deacetylase (PgdA/CDA1 family)
VGVHLRIGGRPSVALGVRRFLEYARARNDVWFATREEIARWWIANPPAAGQLEPAYEGRA